MNWEILSNIVTVFGLPFAILIFLYEQNEERKNEEDEVYQLLSDNYQDFLKVVLDNPDLHLITNESTTNLSNEQKERMFIIYSMLISIFERAYLLLYGKKLNKNQKRRWASWNDYMEEWCRREDFIKELPELLKGEDPDFVEYIKHLVNKKSM